MDLGVVFPQLEIGADPATIERYATAAESAGYGHLLAYDHVLGANPEGRDWADRPYDYRDQFHEPLTLYSYLAAVTDDLRLVTGILILPQRQTALVAKQAAEVDVLSGGRLRLGVGVGWNPVEYEALGQDFRTRGARMEEQVEVLRALWTEELVDYDGRFHRIPDAGINPLPVTRPIPIWMGGGADVVLRRIGRLADGWVAPGRPLADIRDGLDTIEAAAEEAGRDPDDIAVVGRLTLASLARDEWADRVAAWRDFGADALSVNTMGMGLEEPADHVDTILEFRDVADGVLG